MLNFSVLAWQNNLYEKKECKNMKKNELLHDAVGEMAMELEPNKF